MTKGLIGALLALILIVGIVLAYETWSRRDMTAETPPETAQPVA